MSFKEIPNSIEINGQSLKFRDIHKDFSKTPAGNRLNNNTRYARYQGNLENNEWQKLLGFDVNNLEHCRLTQGITYCFINHMNQSDSEIKFSPEEQKLLLLTAIVHDWPEGVTNKGDVSYDQKTEQDEEEELSVIEQIITKTLGPDSLDLSTQVKNILEDNTSRLGMAFNAIERIGYLRTALIAWKKSKNTDQSISTNLILLTNNVLLNSLSKLIEYSPIYPPVYSFINNRQDLISEAFNMPESIFDKYETPQEKEKNINKFNQAKNNWSLWIGKF